MGLKLTIYNGFKFYDLKNIIVIETKKIVIGGGEIFISKAHCIPPLPFDIDSSMNFNLEIGESISVFVDAQSGTNDFPGNDHNYKVVYPELLKLNSIQFDPDPADSNEEDPAGSDRWVAKYRKNNPRKTGWHFTIKYPDMRSSEDLAKEYSEMATMLFGDNHTVEVGDDRQ